MQLNMNYPTEIYADTDIVCGVEPKEGHQKYVRADADMFHDKPAEEAAEELLRLRWQCNRMEWWMTEVTALLCHQPSIPADHKRDLLKSFEAWKHAVSPNAERSDGRTKGQQ